MEGLLAPRPEFVLLASCLTLAAVLAMAILWRGGAANSARKSGVGWLSSDGAAASMVLVFALLEAAYFVFRFHGQWSETDTATITQATAAIRAQGVLVPDRWIYQHGFGYQALVLGVQAATGAPIPILQTAVLPFAGAAVFALCAFAFFRQVTRDRRIAAFGTMILLLQPDLLFVLFRGSHEKIVWPMMMLALAALYGSVARQPLRSLAGNIAAFHLAVFTIVLANVFFASVFLAALALGGVLGYLFLQRAGAPKPLPGEDLSRILTICASGGVLVAMSLLYLYPPAFAIIRNSQSVLEQLGLLLLSFEPASQPYAYIAVGWIGPGAYLALTAFTWLLLAGSFAVWLIRGWALFRGRAQGGLAENLDWFLYAGFGVQLAVSIPVDFSGALAGNLQLRIVPGLTVMAAVLAARAIADWMRRVEGNAAFRRLATMAALTAGWFSLAAVLKATNEPALSNKWGFYSISERAALAWMESRLQGERIWTGPDERLASAYRMLFLEPASPPNLYGYGAYSPSQEYILMTDTDHARILRMGGMPLPVDGWDLLFDNGSVRLYRMPSALRGREE